MTSSPSIVRDWLSESLPLGVGDMLRRVAWQLETLLLAVLQPMAAVGLYSVAFRPLQPLQMLPRTIVSVTFPMMSRAADTDRALVSRTFGRTTAVLWVFSLPIAIGVGVCAHPLILATAGPDYLAAVNPLRLLIWLTGLTFINTQLRFVFSALKMQQAYWRLTGGVLVGKSVLLLTLIPFWGLYGACLGNLLGEFMLTIAGLYALRIAGVGDVAWRAMLAAVPAAATMAAILIPLAVWSLPLAVMLVASAAGTLVYFALCPLLGALDRVHIQRVWDVLQRGIQQLRCRWATARR